MTFTKRERAMLLVALDNLLVDYRRGAKRAKRRDMPATERACNEAVNRYRLLAAKVGRLNPRAAK